MATMPSEWSPLLRAMAPQTIPTSPPRGNMASPSPARTRPATDHDRPSGVVPASAMGRLELAADLVQVGLAVALDLLGGLQQLHPFGFGPQVELVQQLLEPVAGVQGDRDELVGQGEADLEGRLPGQEGPVGDLVHRVGRELAGEPVDQVLQPGRGSLGGQRQQLRLPAHRLVMVSAPDVQRRVERAHLELHAGSIRCRATVRAGGGCGRPGWEAGGSQGGRDDRGRQAGLGVAGGRIVGVRGRAGHRANHGRLGPKGLYGWQANAAPDRLTRPLVREGGELVEASWDQAMDRIVARSRELLETSGGGAFGFYTSGQLFAEEYYTLAVIGKAGLGTPHMDGNTRLCTATAAQSLKESFGCDGQPASYTDVDQADTFFLVGHNAAATQTVLWSRMLDRRRGADPPALVVVDPRPTPTAREADLHLAVRGGTNLALLNAIQHELFVNGWVDRDWVAAHTVGVEELEQLVAGWPPERAAEVCGVDAGRIREAARILGNAER